MSQAYALWFRGSEELSGADVTIVFADHDELEATAIAKHASRVLDTKNVLRAAEYVGEVL